MASFGSWVDEKVADLNGRFDQEDQKMMSFSEALAHVKAGRRVRRTGWNGKGMFIFLVPGSVFKVNREPLLSILGEGTEVQYHGHIDMRTAQGYVVPWLASQADLLDDDWEFADD